MINNGLYVPTRQLSALLASLLIVFCICFLMGYFYGKRCSVAANNEYEYSQQLIPQDLPPLESSLDIYAENVEVVESLDSSHVVVQGNNHIIEGKRFFAQLIGFGTEKAAHAFSQKLNQQYIPTYVKKHANKTAKGRVVNWYQVVTEPYEDRKELAALVEKVSIQEKLKDVVISAC